MKCLKILAVCIAVLSVAAVVPAHAEDADEEAVKAVIAHHLESIGNADMVTFNQADLDKMMADWDSEGAIIDTFPPHLFNGRPPIRQWYEGVRPRLKSRGWNKVHLSISSWLRVNVTGDYAYAPANAVAVMTGPGSGHRSVGTMTFSLSRKHGSWKITGWSWGGAAGETLPAPQ